LYVGRHLVSTFVNPSRGTNDSVECIKPVLEKGGPLDKFVKSSGKSPAKVSTADSGGDEGVVGGEGEREGEGGSEYGLKMVVRETVVVNVNLTKTREVFEREGMVVDTGRESRKRGLEDKNEDNEEEEDDEDEEKELRLEDKDVQEIIQVVDGVLEGNAEKGLKIVERGKVGGGERPKTNECKQTLESKSGKGVSAKKKLKKTKKAIVDKNQPLISLYYGSTD
jgi:hypothetical protein